MKIGFIGDALPRTTELGYECAHVVLVLEGEDKFRRCSRAIRAYYRNCQRLKFLHELGLLEMKITFWYRDIEILVNGGAVREMHGRRHRDIRNCRQ